MAGASKESGEGGGVDTAAKGRVEKSANVVDDSGVVEKRLAAVNTRVLNGSGTSSRAEEEDSTLLSDEEIAWKLHQELNATSPMFRTRSRRQKSNLAESSLGNGGAPERQQKRKKGGGKKQQHKGPKGGGEDDGEGTVGSRKKSQRVVAEPDKVSASPFLSRKGSSDTEKNNNNSDHGVKARSRKGRPKAAPDGEDLQQASVDKNNNSERGVSRKSKGGRRGAPRIPKLPMVQQGGHWYRARVLKENKEKILVEFAGFEHSIPSLWLPKYCERIWYGSYKGKDWRYHGEGAWVPKNGIRNRIITTEDYDVPPASVGDFGRNSQPLAVETPSLQVDGAITGEDTVGKRRKSRGKKSVGEEGSESRQQRLGRKVRSKRNHSTEEDEESGKKSEEDSEENEQQETRRTRPRRAAKRAAIFNNAEFAVDTEVDMMESDVGGWKTFAQEEDDQFFAPKTMHNMAILTSLDEKEALQALTEMPSSPVSLMDLEKVEERIENSREALLEAYTNQAERKAPLAKSQNNASAISRSHTAESIVIAEQMFGGLLHAISSRMEHASTGKKFWSPHIWSSGVTPADGEPAIIHVPISLIEKALESKTESFIKPAPPFPLFC